MSEPRDPSTKNRAFYKIAEVAKRWSCSEKHVRRLIERGALVAHRLGNLLRISDDDLRRYERMNRAD